MSKNLCLVCALAVCLLLGPVLGNWLRAERASHSAAVSHRTEGATGVARGLRAALADYCFVKADSYFLHGARPSMFAPPTQNRRVSGENDEGIAWVERLGRKLRPGGHSQCGGDHPHEHPGTALRESLPWLWASTRLNPQNPPRWTLLAYCLREKLGRPEEALAVLRAGLRANPNDPELLFELGRYYAEELEDVWPARQLWELAWRGLQERAGRPSEREYFQRRQLIVRLAALEEREGRWRTALDYLDQLQASSPDASLPLAWITEMRGRLMQQAMTHD
jgi:tetratricopeptide (TPR) repeat protein